MDNDRASEDKLNRTSPLRLWMCLTLVFGDSDIVPEMKVAAFHLDELTELFEVPLNVETIELRRVAAMEIKNQFISVTLMRSRFSPGHRLWYTFRVRRNLLSPRFKSWCALRCLWAPLITVAIHLWSDLPLPAGIGPRAMRSARVRPFGSGS